MGYHKIFLTLALLFCLSSSAMSATGLKMLTVEAGARPAGMGGAFAAVGGDPYAAAYNPAATWGITQATASVGYNTHWENSHIENAFISFHKKSVVVTGGLLFAGVNDIEKRTAPTSDFIGFDAHDVSLKLGAAFELEENYYLGFGLGYMYEKIDTYTGGAFNFDVGLLVTPHPDINIGLAVLNFGSTVNLRNESFDLPTSYRGGVVYRYDAFRAAADVVNLDGTTHLHVGGEFEAYQGFLLRAGYRTGYDTKDFSAGAGFTKRNLRVDYAFLPYGGNLGNAHMINLTFQI